MHWDYTLSRDSARSNFPFAYNAQFIPDPIELYAFKRDLEIRSFYACRQEKHIFHKSLHILRIEFCQSAFGCLAISARQIAAGFVHSLHDQVEGNFTSTGQEIR